VCVAFERHRYGPLSVAGYATSTHPSTPPFTHLQLPLASSTIPHVHPHPRARARMRLFVCTYATHTQTSTHHTQTDFIVSRAHRFCTVCSLVCVLGREAQRYPALASSESRATVTAHIPTRNAALPTFPTFDCSGLGTSRLSCSMHWQPTSPSVRSHGSTSPSLTPALICTLVGDARFLSLHLPRLVPTRAWHTALLTR
jgi:hypothetical protein